MPSATPVPTLADSTRPGCRAPVPEVPHNGGGALRYPRIAFHHDGDLAEGRDRVVRMRHARTGSSDAVGDVVGPLRDSFGGQGLHRFRGVLRGTSNFMLSRVKRGVQFHDEVPVEVARLQCRSRTFGAAGGACR